MKKRITTIILVLAMLLLLVPGVALASDISTAKWYSTITASNNSTATDDIFTTFPLGTQSLIDSGFLSDNLTDCAMQGTAGTDTAFMPSVNATFPWCFYVSDIGEDAYKNYTLYTGGNADMDGKLRYFPGAGGMTSADNTTLELADNFTIEQKGWIDTDNGTDKNLVNKPVAFRVYVHPTISENITAEIFPFPTSFTDSSADWTNEANAYDGDITSYATGAALATAWTGWLELERSSLLTNDIHYYVHTDTDPEISLIEIDTYYGGAWNDTYYGAFSEGDWVSVSINGTFAVNNVRIRGYNSAGAVRELELAELRYGDVRVSATGVASGNHTVKVDTVGTITGAVLLDGTSDYLYAGDDASLQVDGDNFTIEMWVKFDDVTVHQGLFNQLAAGANRQYAYWSTTQNKVFWRVYDAVPAVVVDYQKAWTPVIDTWYLMHFVHDGNDWAVYVNTGNLGGVIDADDIGANADNATFGWSSIGGVYLKGSMDEIRWYDRAISIAERAYSYNSGAGFQLPFNQTDLEGWWHLDEGSGTISIDETANDNHITLINDATWTVGHIPSQFAIYIDGVEQDGTRMIDVPDNSNDWTFFQNLDTYWHYHKIWIDGVLRQHIEYEYDDTVFSDLSGNSQDAYPTFRTASSDADVSAIMASFLPIEEAQAPIWVLSEERDFWDTENITAAGEFTTTPTPTAAPGVAVIEAIAAASGTPSQLPFTIISAFVIIAISILTTWFMKKHGARNIWMKIIVIVICMALCVGVKVLDFWMIIFFLIMGIAVALFSRQRSVG